MPSYFPENNEPLPSDSATRMLHKLVSLANSWAGFSSEREPAPLDQFRTLYQKLTRSLNIKANA